MVVVMPIQYITIQIIYYENYSSGVNNNTHHGNSNTHNTNAKICRPCALYLGYIEVKSSTGGSYKKKINNKKCKIYIGPKGGKYYIKKDVLC